MTARGFIPKTLQDSGRGDAVLCAVMHNHRTTTVSEIDNMFCRTLLREANKMVKLHFPEINLRKDAWVWHFHRDHWEFHGPANYYWHGSAANAYDARYKGWMAWLESKGIGE